MCDHLDDMSCEAGWSNDWKHKKLYITTYWYHDKSGELYGFGSSRLEHQHQDTILLELHVLQIHTNSELDLNLSMAVYAMEGEPVL